MKVIVIGGFAVAIASAQVTVRETTNPMDGVPTTLIGIKGDKVFPGGDQLPVLGVMCRAVPHKNDVRKYSTVLLSTQTEPVSLLFDGPAERLSADTPVTTFVRFSEEGSPRVATWEKHPDHGMLMNGGTKIVNGPSKFLRQMLQSRAVHIQLRAFQVGIDTVSFDLTGFAEAYQKLDACNQKP